MDKLKAIQGVVILMTSLIILGVGAVIYGLANRNKEPEVAKSIATATEKIPETLILEPLGSKISGIEPCGENLCLMLSGGGESERIAVINRQGYVIRKIRLDFPSN